MANTPADQGIAAARRDAVDWQKREAQRLLAHQEVACALLTESRPHLSLGPIQCLQQLATYILALGAQEGPYTWEELEELCTEYRRRGILPERLERKIERLVAEWI